MTSVYLREKVKLYEIVFNESYFNGFCWCCFFCTCLLFFFPQSLNKFTVIVATILLAMHPKIGSGWFLYRFFFIIDHEHCKRDDKHLCSSWISCRICIYYYYLPSRCWHGTAFLHFYVQPKWINFNKEILQSVTSMHIILSWHSWE